MIRPAPTSDSPQTLPRPGDPPARRLRLYTVQGDNDAPSTATCPVLGLHPSPSILADFRLISGLEKTVLRGVRADRQGRLHQAHDGLCLGSGFQIGRIQLHRIVRDQKRGDCP